MGSAWPEVDLPQKLTAVTTQTEAPAIDVHIVQSLEPPGGMGEAGTSAIVPAVGNAIFAASGKRVRKLPVDTTALK
jgi:isoquinoline 1-oxidoreductase subunit beta